MGVSTTTLSAYFKSFMALLGLAIVDNFSLTLLIQDYHKVNCAEGSQRSAAMHTLWGWQGGPTGHTAGGPSVLTASVYRIHLVVTFCIQVFCCHSTGRHAGNINWGDHLARCA